MNIDDIGKEFKEENILYKTKEIPSNFGINNTWALTTNDEFFPCINTINSLPAATYIVDANIGGFFLKKVDIITDELISIENDNSAILIEHIKQFWGMQNKFDTFDLIYKRGILLYGEPGVGKTGIINQVSNIINSLGGIVILGDYPEWDILGLKIIRKIQPEVPIVLVYEDIDNTIYTYGDKKLTSLLDGQDSIDNLVTIATTNNIERLPAKLLKRTSRFDVVQKIDLPNEVMRAAFFRSKKILSLSEVSTYARETEGLSFSDLKEVIILTKIYDRELKEVVKQMKRFKKRNFTSINNYTEGQYGIDEKNEVYQIKEGTWKKL